MHVRRVRSMEDAEQVRVLRNQNRKSFTRHTDVITIPEQQKWFNLNRPRLWLYGKIAFVMIRREKQRNWITLAVDPNHHGEGIGTMLYHTFKPAWAEIRSDNAGSIRAAEKAGYIKVYEDEDKGLVVMKG